jgi:hypothetical protein
MTPRPIPLVTEHDVQAVARQMRTQWIGRGLRVRELERRMAEWVNASHAVAFGSGTAALMVAMLLCRRPIVRLPDGACEALHAAARLAQLKEHPDTAFHVTIYPERGDWIEDFARYLPREGETRLIGRFGVFSFGALKDVTGGLGGCLVSHAPIDAGDWPRLSPLSDINAALILSQLAHYDGHRTERMVADGKIWRAPA